MKRVLLASLAAVVLLTGAYAAADAYDHAPGILTLPEPVPTGLLAAPKPIPSVELAPAAPKPDPEKLGPALTAALDTAHVGGTVAASVRDGVSGESLFSVDTATPHPLASVQKLLTAYAIATRLDLDATMTTKAVTGATPGEIVLVAGGDTLLAVDASEQGPVVGHASLAELAAQVAAAAPPGPLTVRLDTSYAVGPRYPASWRPTDIDGGYARQVSQIGLAQLRPVNGLVPRPETDADVLSAWATALGAQGREVQIATGEPAPAPPAATLLGEVESASVGDVLGYALQESDNALMETLLRQTMAKAQRPVPADGNLGPFVVEALATAGLDTAAVSLSDAAGLAPDQQAPVDVVDGVLELAMNGRSPAFRRVLTTLPVAGATGTLANRFQDDATKAVVGIPRAKTGSLTGVSALAGTTMTADGRLLTFVVVAAQVPETGTLEARAALDRFVAALTACGCR